MSSDWFIDANLESLNEDESETEPFPWKTGFELMPARFLSFGCPIIDSVFGGLPQGQLVEINGESGSGKTQICLQFCLQVQMKTEHGGLDGYAVYISTENSFPSERFDEMTNHYINQGYFQNEDPKAHVFIRRVFTTTQLAELLGTHFRNLFIQTKRKIKLIIIDSIASLIRFEFSKDEAIEKTRVLGKISYVLHSIARLYSVCVLVVNHVTINCNDFSCLTSGSTKAALGPSWAQCVNTRLTLSKTNRIYNGLYETNVNSAKIFLRKMEIEFSPTLPHGSCHLFIDGNGVHGISNDL